MGAVGTVAGNNILDGFLPFPAFDWIDVFELVRHMQRPPPD
jgi:hypothetical protein